jgi:hypothetical protein
MRRQAQRGVGELGSWGVAGLGSFNLEGIVSFPGVVRLPAYPG